MNVNNLEASSDGSKYLCWKDRPKFIQNQSDRAFESVNSDTVSNWRYNGATQYNMLGIEEQKLIKKIIQNAAKEQKDFYLLDIGSGNFQWGKAVVRYINEQKDLPEDIKVHVIGVRGEGGDSTKEEIGKCKLYELTSFKIENLYQEFEKNGLFLEKKLDFAISRWCFRHLVDPLGTFVQVHDLLRPGSGTFIADGFFSIDRTDEKERWGDQAPWEMLDLLVKTKAPFLLDDYDQSCSIVEFILQRPNENPCQLDMKYIDLAGVGFHSQESKFVTIFDKGKEKYGEDYFHYNSDRTRTLYGDKKIYDWLRKDDLIGYEIKFGMASKECDSFQERFKLHQAVIEGDLGSLEQLIKDGFDIDEGDLEGYTPLHLAIKHKQFECFAFLLKQGANQHIPSSEKRTKSFFDNGFLSLVEEAKFKNYDEKYTNMLEENKVEMEF